MNKNQFETLVKDLLIIHHYRVEVYSPKGGVKSNDWFLELKGSPGNLTAFEDIFNSELDVGKKIIKIFTNCKCKSRIN